MFIGLKIVDSEDNIVFREVIGYINNVLWLICVVRRFKWLDIYIKGVLEIDIIEYLINKYLFYL